MTKNYGMELLWMMPKKGKLCKKKINRILLKTKELNKNATERKNMCL